MQTYYLTDAGKVRSHNEDGVVILKNKSGDYLMAVADGMGGHKAGEVASNLAIEYLTSQFIDLESMDKQSAINWIRTSVSEINHQIFQYTSIHEDSKGMGSTLVLAILSKDYLLFGNIGDSSGFVMKDHKLHKVTKDHTLVNLLVSTGELTSEEAKMHPKKNVLMRALGANDPIEIDIFDVDMSISSVLLCSDGLTNMLSHDQVERVLNTENLSIEDVVLKLIRKSNNRGGTDNISVAYLIKEVGE